LRGVFHGGIEQGMARQTYIANATGVRDSQLVQKQRGTNMLIC